MKFKLTKTSFYILSFTWGLPLTLVGLVVSLVMILTGHRPHRYGWTWYFDAGENWGGSEFGICFVKAHDEGERIMKHEFGHGIQNCIYGPFTPIIVNLPSSARYWWRRIIRAAGREPARDYYDIWFEKEADKLGEYYHSKIFGNGGTAMKYLLDETFDLEINGDMQNIHIRSNAPDKDVLLFVHGGPGVCDRSWVMPDQSKYLADYCVMVCWDQRMSGKNYRKAKVNQEVTLDTMVEDMHCLVEYLRKRFGKEKIYFVGHSWGSILGVLYLTKYADTIEAYVGMGQFINGPLNEQMSYDFVVNYAKEHGDKKALKDLAEIGAPVDGLYAGGIDALMVQRNYMTKFGGGCWKEKENIYKSVVAPFIKSGEYHIIPDLYRYAKGSFWCLEKLWGQVVALKYDETVKSLNTRVYLFQGDHDQNTPTVLAKAWFDALDAPYKEYVPFHESAHSPIKEEKELWGKTLREKLWGIKD